LSDDEKLTNGGEAGNYITNDNSKKKFPMVELVTKNKALPGDGLDFHFSFQ
jgi:hypothetical protein